MGKLSTMKPAIGKAPPSIGWAPADKAERERYRNAQPWRAWYHTARWKALRLVIFVRDGFRCQWPGCGVIEHRTSKLVADHRKAHRGDESLFWDEGNLQTLCKPCHDSRKQREEAGR